jgi:LysM repeat protein
MRALREMSGGLIVAVVSVLLVLGGISLSLAENQPDEPPTPTPLPPIIATSIELPTFTPSIVNTNTPEVATQTATQTFTASPSATLAVAAVCNPPTGWIQIIVSASDTLYTIAERYKTTAEILNISNCLNNTIPAVGARLYVPPVPTVTVIPCGPLAGWIKAYTVKRGDNLYRISLLYRTTVALLQRANCMGSSTIIYVGQVLYVPNVPTSTPGVTDIPSFNTATPSFTPQPTSTTAPVTDTPAPSPTTAPTDTSVPTATPPTVQSITIPSPTNSTSP